MKTGLNGCKRVWINASGRRGNISIHKAKAIIHKNGRAKHDLGSMVGEIFPDMTFSFFVKIDQNECMWVIVYTDECNGVHDQREEEKRR